MLNAGSPLKAGVGIFGLDPVNFPLTTDPSGFVAVIEVMQSSVIDAEQGGK
jgi:hypothetical protein